MTRVDFYVSKDETETGRWHIAGRLAEKAFTAGQRVHIHTGNSKTAGALDQFMWTFKDGSFLPHACLGDALIEPNDTSVPIVIGANEQPPPNMEILINLDHIVPEFFSRMERVLEIVGGDAQARKSARDRFKFYRDRGYDLNTHNL